MPHLTHETLAPAGPTSNFYTTPFPHAPGDKARDKDGNEYVFVDFLVGPVYFGCVVGIDSNYRASPLLGTARVAARVGIVMGGDGTTNANMTSDNGGWVQVYGLHQAVQTGSASDGLTSDNTVDYVCVAQTSVGSPTGVMSVTTQVAGPSIAQTSTDLPRIYGMWVVPRSEVSDLVSDWNAWTSGTSGPVSEAIGTTVLPNGTATSGVSDTLLTTGATSAFIGSSHVVFLNYPYVTGVADAIGTATT